MKDCRGLELSAASIEAVQAFDETITAYLGLRPDTGDKLKAIFEADPEMPMAHCLKGYFFHLMGSGGLLPRARQAFDTATRFVASATPREQAHVKALGLWCDDDHQGAGAVWEDILQDHPLDALALRLAHHAHFYSGDAAAMRASIDRVFPAWDESLSGYGFVLGMRAFAYEESGNYAEAEKTGRLAVETQADDPWAIHAVAHVMEMQDRQREGIEWIKGLEPHWVDANNFRYHLWWHRALMHLGVGENEEVLRLYDEDLWDADSDEYLDLCNDVALLSRLEMQGVDVGERWLPVADKVKGRTKEHILSFIDAHFAIALGAVGDWQSAEQLVETFSIRGGQIRDTIGAPLCRALVAHRRGAFGDALSELKTIHGDIRRIGGSNAQRDLFEQIYINAAIGAGELSTACSLLEGRTIEKPGNALSWQMYGNVLSAMGQDSKSSDAHARANTLLRD